LFVTVQALILWFKTTTHSQ